MNEIVSSPHDRLDPGRRQELQRAAEVEFGEYAIVRETAWAAPDWTFTALEGARLACFYNLVLRSARFDDLPIKLAGLNNLITLPEFRGRGLASRLLEQTTPEWSRKLGAECGLLLCSDELLPFYRRLGWRAVDCPVRFAQPSGEQIWGAKCMILPLSAEAYDPRDIDLGGLPW